MKLFEFRENESISDESGIRTIQALAEGATRDYQAQKKQFLKSFNRTHRLLHKHTLAVYDDEGAAYSEESETGSEGESGQGVKDRHSRQAEKNVDGVYELLMRSQLTVVANSGKVRMICIPQHCLNHLSEPVRRQIRQRILDLYIPMPKEKSTAWHRPKKVAAGQEDFSNTQIISHRYNFIDLVDRPFNTDQDFHNFVKINQDWEKDKQNKLPRHKLARV